MRTRAEIHHEADHLVPAQRGKHAARRALGRKDDDVLVLAVRDEEVHEPCVLELVSDNGKWDLLRDACAADLEVTEVGRDEDDPATVIASRLQVRLRSRIDLHQLVELGVTHRWEPHDLGEVLAEVAERAPGYLRHLAVLGRSPEDDGEVPLRDLSPAPPHEVRELAAHDGTRVDQSSRKVLHQGRRDAPRPVEAVKGDA